MFAPITQALIDDAGIVQGQSVLDVAGGSGEPSLTIRRKSWTKRIRNLCSDVVAEMVSGAQSEAQQSWINQHSSFGNVPLTLCHLRTILSTSWFVAWEQCFSRILWRVCARCCRVTKPSGVIALAVWGRSELNPFFSLFTDALERQAAASAPPDPDAPGAFRFCRAR